MPTNEKKGITVKIDAELHAEVRQYLEQHSMTMADFVTMALQDELHPKIEQKEEKSMEKMRTLAFQVPEDLFQKIKDGRTVIVRRERICDCEKAKPTKKDDEVTLLDFLNGLSPEQQRAALVHLSVMWAEKQGGFSV